MLNREMPGSGAFVWSGVHRIVLAPAPTRPVALEVVRKGDLFGFFSSFEKWGDALRLECRDSGVLLVMKGSSFASLRKEAPALAEVALAAVARRAADHGARIFELATLNARERVIAELLRLARDGEWCGCACRLHPPPTHQDLAEHVGAAREVVTRVLKRLHEEGLISSERGRCEIPDMTKLVELDERATGRRLIDPSACGAAVAGGLAGAAWLASLATVTS